MFTLISTGCAGPAICVYTNFLSTMYNPYASATQNRKTHTTLQFLGIPLTRRTARTRAYLRRNFVLLASNHTKHCPNPQSSQAVKHSRTAPVKFRISTDRGQGSARSSYSYHSGTPRMITLNQQQFFRNRAKRVLRCNSRLIGYTNCIQTTPCRRLIVARD